MSAAVKIYKHFETPKEPGVYHRLICLTGKDKGKAYFLTGKRIIMGRSEQVDVTVLDMKSSREHGEIINVGDNYILTDLGSQNGIIVNDLKIKQHTLQDGDKIIIGKTVFKFSRVEVKAESTEIKKRIRQGLEEEDELAVDEPEAKSLNKGLMAIIALAAVVLVMTETEKVTQRKKRTISKDVKDLVGSQEFGNAIKERNRLDKTNQKKLEIYFQRGLREYREGNYFRALEEFKAAQGWSPQDTQARNYYRQTVEKLNETIELHFASAVRNSDAVKYVEAAQEYCAVVRLLIKNQDDERYIKAKNGVSQLEKKMGLEEGEIKCANTEGVNK